MRGRSAAVRARPVGRGGVDVPAHRPDAARGPDRGRHQGRVTGAGPGHRRPRRARRGHRRGARPAADLDAATGHDPATRRTSSSPPARPGNRRASSSSTARSPRCWRTTVRSCSDRPRTPAAEAPGRTHHCGHLRRVVGPGAVDGRRPRAAPGRRRHAGGPRGVVALVAERGIDVLETTPSYVARAPAPGPARPRGHRARWRGGRGRPVARARRASGRAVNLYGPTESTVDAVVADLAATDHPVIGAPVAGTRALVLDDRLTPVAPGVLGELYLAGAGLARATWTARPDGRAFRRRPLRSSRLPDVPDRRPGPLDRRRRPRLRRAGRRAGQGARVPRRARGGRRGARCRPRRGPGGHRRGDRRIRVHDARVLLVPEEGVVLDVDAVRTAAAERLPDYMLPSAMAVLDELPLTVHGKLDRRALPEPEAVGAAGGTPPRTRVSGCSRRSSPGPRGGRGRRRRQLLRPRRPLAARHPPGLPDPQRDGPGAGGAGALRDSDRRGPRGPPRRRDGGRVRAGPAPDAPGRGRRGPAGRDPPDLRPGLALRRAGAARDRPPAGGLQAPGCPATNRCRPTSTSW